MIDHCNIRFHIQRCLMYYITLPHTFIQADIIIQLIHYYIGTYVCMLKKWLYGYIHMYVRACSWWRGSAPRGVRTAPRCACTLLLVSGMPRNYCNYRHHSLYYKLTMVLYWDAALRVYVYIPVCIPALWYPSIHTQPTVTDSIRTVEASGSLS